MDSRDLIGLCGEQVVEPDDQSLFERGLESIVSFLDHPVLMRLAGLDARRTYAVVIEYGGKPSIELAAAAGNLVGRRGQIVAAERLRYASEVPEGVLQAANQRLECLRQRQLYEAPLAVRQDELKQQK